MDEGEEGLSVDPVNGKEVRMFRPKLPHYMRIDMSTMRFPFRNRSDSRLWHGLMRDAYIEEASSR